MTTTEIPTDDPAALAERMLADFATVTEYLSMHLGVELGLFEALAQGPATPADLAGRADVDPRCTREWLEQLTVAGWLTCPAPEAAPEKRRYALPAAVAAVLADPTSEAYMAPLLRMAGGVAAVLPKLVEAYRSGDGVPFADYGAQVRHGLGVLNGGMYDAFLASWIATMPDIHHLLSATANPRILDLGCGTGRAALALARAYPGAMVHGVDLDPASVADARAAAAAEGLAHRVSFAQGDAADSPHRDRYHLITFLEALHDMGDPIGALRTAHGLLAPGGAVFISDQRCPDHFTADGDVLARFQYGASALHCLPATMAEDPVIAHGTVLRAPTVDAWARAAGFAGATVLDIEDEFWQMYRLS